MDIELLTKTISIDTFIGALSLIFSIYVYYKQKQ